MRATILGAVLFIGAAQAQAAPTTVTYQEGVGGYADASDTYVMDILPTNNFNFSPDLLVEGTAVRQTLIQFGGIVGSGSGQITSGATVSDATLTLEVSNTSSSSGIEATAILASWDSTTITWDNATLANGSAGIQTDDLEARSTPFASSISVSGPNLVLDLTALVQEWVNGSLANNGIMIHDPSGSTDAAQFYSSNWSTPSQRPELSVTFESFDSSGVPAPGALALLGFGLLGLGMKRRVV